MESVLIQLQNLKESIDELTKSVNNLYQHQDNLQTSNTADNNTVTNNTVKKQNTNTKKEKKEKKVKLTPQQLYYSAYSLFLQILHVIVKRDPSLMPHKCTGKKQTFCVLRFTHHN